MPLPRSYHLQPCAPVVPPLKYVGPQRQFGWGLTCEQRKAEQKDENHPLYKTVMCRYLRSNKPCPHGDRCCFAHSLEELRPRQQSKHTHKRPCLMFFRDGHCPYGPKCLFLHKVTEKDKSRMNKDMNLFLQYGRGKRLPVFQALCAASAASDAENEK